MINLSRLKRLFLVDFSAKWLKLVFTFYAYGGSNLGARRCTGCGAVLGDDDVMKLVFEDGSCEIFPFSTCPECLKKELEKAHR